MLKIKLKHTNLMNLFFELFILSGKQQTKLKLVLTQKFFVQVYTHFDSGVKKVKTERLTRLRPSYAHVWGL